MACPVVRVPPVTLALVLLLAPWTGPRPVDAQAAGGVEGPVPPACARVAPGDRVSVQTVDPPGRWIGTLVRYDGEALVIGRGGTEEVLPVRSVSEARVECQLPGRGEARSGSGFTRGFLIGGLAGAVVGTLLLHEVTGPAIAPVAFLAGAVPGGIFGGLAGAGPGEERRWVEWDLTPNPFAPDAWSVGVSLPLPRR